MLMKIEEFLQTNKQNILLILSVIIVFALPMIIFGVEKTIFGAAMLIGVLIWFCLFSYLFTEVFLEKIDKFFEDLHK